MTMTHGQMVLIDLEREGGIVDPLLLGAHPLDVSPARLPASITGADLAKLRGFVTGLESLCDATLAFRFQDLDDLGVPTILPGDRLVGLYRTCGLPIVQIPERVHLIVHETFAAGGGISLSRPGRHLLCARFYGLKAAAAAASPRIPYLTAGVAT